MATAIAAAAATSTSPADVEVRREDQEMINEFGKLNNRLLEIRAELKQGKLDVEKLDDATTELTMASGSGKVMLLIGESFIEADEEYAEEYCERKVKSLEKKISKLTNEEGQIVRRQEELKKVLYSKFGDSINLEN